jgi:17beta-estradiol 17-dehydrogenase / 3alpha(17beta)-hydroxysteroid dehydrogenase (NAD+) / 3-oxoacyl-[acyl-carrier protein] reductase alpha subunit
MKHAVQKMVEAQVGGSVVNISSVTAKMGNIGQSNYAPSKAAVESMTRVAAKEFARYGVRVNCVIPGMKVKFSFNLLINIIQCIKNRFH